MKIRTKIVIVLAMLAGSVGMICLSHYFFRAWFNSSAEADWIAGSEEEDTTERHRQNMQETYQILPDHILMIPDKGEYFGELVRMDRRGRKRESILPESVGSVNSFLEVDQKIYYYNSDLTLDDDRTSAVIGCYDMVSEDSRILVNDPWIDWFTLYQNQILYTRCGKGGNIKEICLFDETEEKRNVIYRFKDEKFYNEQIFLAGDNLLLLGYYEDGQEDKMCLILLPLRSPQLIRLMKWDKEIYNTFLLENTLYAETEDELYQIVVDPEQQTAAVEAVLPLSKMVGRTIYCRGDKLYNGRFQCIN